MKTDEIFRTALSRSRQLTERTHLIPLSFLKQFENSIQTIVDSLCELEDAKLIEWEFTQDKENIIVTFIPV